MGSYAVIEVAAIADCALAIEGASLADLFETAARALAELMVDPATIAPRVQPAVTLEAPSLDLLLYDWLAELIFLKDAELLVVTQTEVDVAVGTPCRLHAQCVGGVIDRGRTVLRADPKAVTFHQFTLEPRATGWHARVVIDI
jgi:SHS2 domain-containing protein